uniref:T9SS type A sorting domain-containing protein n=1 Tax=Gelidibacter sp. TaxID=2018083 RepID=UPI00404AC9A5
MKKSTLLLMVALMSFTFINAQSGNTINDAIEINGTGVGLNVLDFNSASASGLMPACGSSDDVFYKHTVSTGDNKFTVGMVSAAITLLTNIEFQLFKAPLGDMGNLEEVTCDDYTVLLVVGGSFEQVIEDVNEGDEFYLRVYRPTGLGGLLTSLLNGTSITMVSEFDSTLSIGNVTQTNFKVVVNDNQITLFNNTEYSNFKIYSLDGKQMMSQQSNQSLNDIDISVLRNGLYVLMLEDKASYKTLKFIKN